MSAADANKNGTNGQPPREVSTQTGLVQKAAAPAALSAAPTAFSLLKALKRRAVLAGTLGTLAALSVAAAVWFLLPPAKRVASVQMRLESSLWNPLGQPRDDPHFAVWRDNQRALLKNRMVLQRALNDPKVRTLNVVQNTLDPVEWLEEDLKVDFPLGTEFMRINLSGDDPEELKILVDAVANAFLKEYQEKDSHSKRKRKEDLEKLRDESEGKLKLKREEKTRLANDLVAGNNAALNQIRAEAEAQRGFHVSKLLQLEGELTALEAEEDLFRQQDPGNVKILPAQVEARIDKRDDVTQIQKQLEELAKTIAHNKTVAANPQIANKKYLDAKAELEAKLDKTRKEAFPEEEAHLRQDLAGNVAQHLQRLKLEIQRNKNWQEKLRGLIELIDKKNPKIVKGQLEFAILDQEIAMYEDMVKSLNREVNVVEAEIAGAPVRVERLSEAIVQRADETSRKFRFAGLAGVGTLGAVLALIAFLEFRARRIMSVDEVVNGLGLPLMGTLPAHPTKPVSPSSAAHAAFQTVLAESVDSARTMLLHAARAGSMRIVMVTSATSGEGKTSLASHLAVSLARAGRRTLLVDCDLRNPAAHRLFEVPLEPGFSEVLRGEVELEDAVKLTKAAGLSLLPAGICDSEALQLLAQDGPKGLFAQLRADYDFVMIDSSPVLPVADSLLIAQHVDGVIFSILRDVSRMPKVYAAYQKLATLDAPLLGAVVNGTQEDLYGYGPRYLSAAAGVANNNG